MLSAMLSEVKVVKRSLQQSYEAGAELSALAAFSSELIGFSSLAGLRELGLAHAAVRSGTAGSADEVLQGFQSIVDWLFQNFSANVFALGSGNRLVTFAMDIADSGGSVGEKAVVAPAKPSVNFVDFSFHPAVPVMAASLDLLAEGLSATKSGFARSEADRWRRMHSKATELGDLLEETSQRLAATTQGAMFERAAESMRAAGVQSRAFSGNALVMAGHVDHLATIPARHLPAVLAAQASVKAMKDPAARVSAEAAALTSLSAAIQADVPPAVPTIRNLMVPHVDAGNGGRSIATGLGDVAGRGRVVTTGLGATGPSIQNPAASVPGGAGNWQAVDDGLASSGGIGANQPGTSPSSVAAPHAAAATGAPNISAPSPATNGIGLNNPGTAAHHATHQGALSPIGLGGVGGNGSPNGIGGFDRATLPQQVSNLRDARTGVGGGVGGFGTGRQDSRNHGAFGRGDGSYRSGIGNSYSGEQSASGNTTSLPGGAGRSSGLALPGSPRNIHAGNLRGPFGGPLGAGSGGQGAIGGASSGVSGGTAGPGGALSGSGTGLGGGNPTVVGGAPSQTATGGRSGVMGSPIGGSTNRPKKRSKSNMRSITTAPYERSKNLKDLLGEPQKVVPGVIGAWVRDVDA